MKNLYTYIIEKILINKHTEIQNHKPLEWPMVYNVLCSCDFSSIDIYDFRDCINDNGDVYLGCVKSSTKEIDDIDTTFFDKYNLKLINKPHIANNFATTILEENPNIIDSFNKSLLYKSRFNDDYVIVQVLITNKGYYIILLTSSNDILNDFYKLFEHNTSKAFNWIRVNDIKIY